MGQKLKFKNSCLELAEEGKACIFISSELDEVMRTSHRIVVFRDQYKVANLLGDIDEQTIMQTMAGSGDSGSDEL